MSVGNLPESSSQGIFVGIILVGRLGAAARQICGTSVGMILVGRIFVGMILVGIILVGTAGLRHLPPGAVPLRGPPGLPHGAVRAAVVQYCTV